jgi:type IV pilus assembly protein PilM
MGLLSNLIKSVNVSRASQNVLGIDIGSSSIKVVELEEKNSVLTLVTYGEIQLGPYDEKALGAAVQLGPKQEQEALVDVIRESAVKASQAVFAMPLSASFISTTILTVDEGVDLSASVRIEARKIIPASLSEVTLDWAELEAVSGQEGRPVLIAAIQNTAIERLNVLMQFVGLQNSPTEIECFSTSRTVSSTGHSIVMDFGASSAKMYISNEGVLNRMHRINVGGTQVTQQFAELQETDFETAELKKIQITHDSAEHASLKGVYTKVYGRALREFRQVIDHYQSAHDVEINMIHVCGGASLHAGVNKMIQDAVGIPAEYINPFANVAYPAFMEDAMKEIGPSFVPALGAALRHFE